MRIRTGFSFDDLLLVPRYSEVKSRKQVQLSTHLGKHVTLTNPVVSANMKNVTGSTMAKAIAKTGGLGLLHRFDDYKTIVKNFSVIISENPEYSPFVGISVGVKEEDKLLVDDAVNAGCKIICVDVAHGHSSYCGEMTSWIAKKYPEVLLISGNVATYLGVKFLYDNGADVVKCGIGGGSLCTTRIETGNGVPQLTTLEDCYRASLDTGQKVKIIADGGLRKAGDLVKALCFSHSTMLGNLLAGTDEAPGNTIQVDGRLYKEYAGSSTHKSNHIEGVVAMVPYKGPVNNILNTLLEGVRSGLSYQGCYNLEELRDCPEFIQVTNAGLIESHPHDVKVIS